MVVKNNLQNSICNTGLFLLLYERMNQLKPHHVLLFTIGVFLPLLALMFVVPDSGFEFGSLTLKYPTADKFFNQARTQKKDISDILAKVDTTLNDIDTTKNQIKHKNTDSDLGNPSDTSEIKTGNVTQRIEFGPEGASILYPFFAKMRNASKEKKTIRILHYGDSQIEGDRITAFIRGKLQSKFGGSGPGLIPAYNQYHTVSFTQTLSSNFKRYTAFGNVDKKVKHKKYGVMVSFARFTDIIEDSLIATLNNSEGWIEIAPHKSAHGHAKSFNRIRMFYGNCKTTTSLKVYKDGELIHEDTLIPDGNYHIFELRFNETPQSLKYVFVSKSSPDIYAFSLDGTLGIAIDNIAMRGSSGTFLGQCDQSLMKRMYDDLGVELFIMQFGGNVMPYLDDEKELKQYAGYFESQLHTLRRLRPSACILVIGPSDMSVKDGEEYKTYPLLPLLVQQLKEAAFKARAGYWDMYSAMGGENSMPTWVEKELASPDYIHFSPSGARYIAQMFYDAFILEYKKFETHNTAQEHNP